MAASAAFQPNELALGASVRAVIAASPSALWPWIGDPTRDPMLAGSGEPQSITVVGGEMRGVGTEFEAQQAILGVIRYVTRSAVVAYEEERHLHFLAGGRSDWEFVLEPRDGGTLVTHRFRTRLPAGPFSGLLRRLLQVRVRQNARGMVRTLENLARLAGAPPTNVQVSYAVPSFE